MSTHTITRNLLCNSKLLLQQKEEQGFLTIEELLCRAEESQILPAAPKRELEKIRDQLCESAKMSEEEESVLLFYFIEHVLYPAIEEVEEEQLDTLLDLEERAKTRLASLLPEGCDLDQFFQQLANEEVLSQRLGLLESHYRAQMQDLYEKANLAAGTMRATFEEMKEQIIDLADRIQSSNIELSSRIGELFERAQVTEALTFESMEGIQGLGSRFAKHQYQTKTDCEALL